MILDANLMFADGKDAAVTTTKAIKLGGVAYKSLKLYVTAAQAVASLGVTLETCATEGGTYRVLKTWPAVSNVKAGDTLVCEHMPWKTDAYVRIKLSAAAKINAYLAEDVPLEYPTV